MADRPATQHYGIVEYGPRDTSDPMDVYTVYNTAMETIDRILFDLQGQIARNKKAIEDLDAKVERYNTALNARIDALDAKVEQYHEEFKQFKATTEQKFTQVDNHFIQLDGKTDNIWTAIANILNKTQGGGTADKTTGTVTWGDTTGKLAVGNINLNSGSGYIRTHDGTADNDLKAV